MVSITNEAEGCLKNIMTFWDKIKVFLKIDGALADGRNHHIDALKGVAIILVVLGHSIQLNDPNYDNNLLFRIVYSFQLPMFFFLSGFILSTQVGHSLLNYLKKNTVRLLVPFIVWYLISYIFVRFQTEISLPDYLFALIKSPAGGLWFLWVLFLNSFLLFAALKIARFKNWMRWENYFVIAAILLSRTASADFLGLSEVKQYFPYYAAGFFVCKYLDVLKAKRKIIYAVAIVAFPVLILGWKRNEFPTFYPVLLQFLNDKGTVRLIVSIYKYAVSFLGIALSSFILAGIKGTRAYWVLCWLGTLTLDIYVCHGYFIFGFGSGMWWNLSVALVSLILSCALTLLLMKRFKITRLLLLGQSR